MTRFLYLLIGGGIVTACLRLYLFDEMLALWSLAVSLSSPVFEWLDGWVFPLWKKFVFVEVPKRIVILLGWLGLPREWRQRILVHLRLRRTQLTALWQRNVDRLNGRFGRHTSKLLIAAAVLGTSVLIFVFWSGYILFWVWAIKIPAFVSRFWSAIVLSWLKNLMFRVFMFTQISVLWRALFGRMPETARQRYRSFKFRHIRKFVRRRRIGRRRLKEISFSRYERIRLIFRIVTQKPPPQTGDASQGD